MRRKALKITVFLILSTYLLSGCSAARRTKTGGVSEDSGNNRNYAYSDLSGTNISANGFFIRKMKLNVDIDGIRESYTAHLRRSSDGKWLAGIQLLSIEIARIYCDRDSIVILDRVGRTASVIGWEKLEAEYGISYHLLPLLLGDLPLVANQTEKYLNCRTATKIIAGSVGYDIIADCSVPRAKLILLSPASDQRTIEIRAEGYDVYEGYPYSSVITAKEKSGSFDARISIEEILIPWDGEVRFLIPQNYKVKRK